MNKKKIKTSGTNKASSFKTGFLFFISFLFCSSIFAQDQFLWTNQDPSNDNWQNANNWDYYPLGTTIRIYPAPFYPGQGGLINTNGPKDDIAIFTDLHNEDCLIDRISAGTDGGLRVGGIIVKGYSSLLKQKDGNRLYISEAVDAGGFGVWDNSTLIKSDHLNLASVNLVQAYQAYFEFGPGPMAGFQGGAIPVPFLTSGVPSLALMFAVPLKIVSGNFKAPFDEMRIRHDANILSTANFDHSLFGATVLSNRNAGISTRNYEFYNVAFWDLKVTPNSGSGDIIKNFSGGVIKVEHDFKTTGSLGLHLGPDGSDPIVMNGTVGTAIHIKNDLIIGHKFDASDFSYDGFDDMGTLILVMKGPALYQYIRHDDPNDFTGILPHLHIDKSNGVVYLDGPVAVNGNINFSNSLVSPNDATTTQYNIRTVNDVFLLNSNATVSNASDFSFCTGPIRARTGKEIELPIGKVIDGVNHYRPAVIKFPTGISIDNMYTAEYFEAPISALTPPSSFENPPLSLITDCEMWAIDKEDVTGSDPWTFHLGLSFDPSSCSASLIYDDTCKVAVSRWDESELRWKSHGNDGLFPIASNGDQTIRTSLAIVVPNFERSLLVGTLPDLFTFGKLAESACITEPCDVNVCVDYCQIQDSFKFDPNIVYGPGSSPAGISWDFGDGGTSAADNPVYGFDMDGVHMVTVTVFAVNDGDTCSTIYTFGIFNNSCTLPSMEMIQNNNNNQPKDSKAVPTVRVGGSDASLRIAPNPSSTGAVQFSLETKEKGAFNYVITNNLGQNILTGTMTGNERMTINTSKLAAGSYIMSVQLLDKKVTQQFMIIK